ncbi:hypothetical protein [Salipaludibacillus sp. CF4.18]
MASKFMSAIKKAEKFGELAGDAKAAKNGGLTKRVASRKAKNSFMKIFK